MINKILLITLFFLINNINAQSYYNPTKEINIRLIVKQPYKPLNYAEIGQNFNNMVQQDLVRREAQKRYFNDIYYETRNSVQTNTYLTNDNIINQKILQLQNTAIEQLNMLNRLLTNGAMNPNEYESHLRNTYFYYINTNQAFLNINRYQYLKLNEIKDVSLANKFNNNFNEAINSISKFNFNDYNVSFVLEGLLYPNSTTDNLFYFVTSSCEGFLDSYKNNWDDKQRQIKEEEKRRRAIILEENNKREADLNAWINSRNKIFKSRKTILDALTVEQANVYRKTERKSVINYLKKQKKVDINLKDIKPRKLVNYYFAIENENHEFVRLLKNGNIEPLVYNVPRLVIIGLHFDQKYINNK